MRKLLFVVGLLPLFVVGQRLDGGAIRALQKFDRFYGILGSVYVDSVDHKRLIDDAITEVLAELDPHSVYLSAEEMKESDESFQGSFSGIGIEFNVLRDTLIVVQTIAGGPSERVGMMANDRIVSIDGADVVGISRERAPKLLRGVRGTAVVLGVVRGGEVLEFRVVRDNIPITTVDAAYKLDARTGYVRVNRFAQTTMDEFQAAVAAFGAVDAIVLDLRGNGGGYLHMATDMANYFLEKGNLIVATEGMRAPSETYSAERQGEFRKGKVIVLIDEMSASASEIVAGALQDWDRAVVVGRRSFGKGLVQQQFGLQDGSAVRITVSRYLTPTGRAIQRPFKMGQKEEYYKDWGTAVSDSTHVYKTLRLGKRVYGGGGIVPDFVVEADTVGISDYYVKLVRAGVVGEFIVSYLDRNRASLAGTYPSFVDYDARFEVGDEALGQLVALGVERGVAADAQGLADARALLGDQLKAAFAERLWGQTAYWRVMGVRRDPVLSRAREILSRWDKMARGVVVL